MQNMPFGTLLIFLFSASARHISSSVSQVRSPPVESGTTSLSICDCLFSSASGFIASDSVTRINRFSSSLKDKGPLIVSTSLSRVLGKLFQFIFAERSYTCPKFSVPSDAFCLFSISLSQFDFLHYRALRPFWKSIHDAFVPLSFYQTHSQGFGRPQVILEDTCLSCHVAVLSPKICGW